MRLDRLPWRDDPDACAIFDALGADMGLTRVVGGAVRDIVLGLSCGDIDAATELAPDDVVRRLVAAGLRAIPTGIAHGTVTALSGHSRIEVTTLRHDTETDGRRASVAFTDDWRADAARRDLTVNALYADPLTGELFDYFGGLDDLAARRVRFIGDPRDRIREDHLRILRFYRFSALLGDGEPDAQGLAACAEGASLLARLSGERIRDELFKLLALPMTVPTLARMRDGAILRDVLPQIDWTQLSRLQRLVDDETMLGIAADALRRLAILLPADATIRGAVARRLRLSRAQSTRLLALAAMRDFPDDPRTALYRHGRDGAVDCALVAAPDPVVAVQRLGDLPLPVFPVDGAMLSARGVQPGIAMGRLLAGIETAWIEAGYPSAAADIERLIAQAMLSARSAQGTDRG